MIGGVQNAVLVVVRVGAAVRVLEAVFVLGRVGAAIELVDDLVSVAVRRDPGRAVEHRVHAEHDDVRVIGPKLAVRLKDVDQPDGRADPVSALLEEKIVARLKVQDGTEQPTGGRRADVTRAPDPREPRDSRRVGHGEWAHVGADRSEDRVRASLRQDGRVLRIVALCEEHRADL